MMRSILGIGSALVLLMSCGRSQLNPSDLEALAESGASGSGGSTHVNGGKAAGGTTGSSGASGGKPSMAGMPMVAGMPSEGGGSVIGGEGGEGGAPVVCDFAALSIQRVFPPNGTVGFDSIDPVRARFHCLFDPLDAFDLTARQYGQLGGHPKLGYPPSLDPRELSIYPEHYPSFFAGERVTAWLAAELGGPYLWQYTHWVKPSSPGKFVVGTQDLSVLSQARNFALGDVDGDHDLDLVAGAYQADMQLWLNDGAGTFEARGTLPSQGVPAVVDVDHDGDLDIIGDGPLLANLGHGTFAVGPTHSGCTVTGDFDGDGDLDCIQYGGYRPDETTYGYVLFNQDGRNFEPGPETAFGSSCDVADLDGDADLDAVCVGVDVRAFLNDGKGAFTRSKQKLGELGSRDLALGDVDGDHDFDLVVAVWYGGGKYRANLLWLNDGTGTFGQGGSIGAEGAQIELGDLDGDRDLDLIVSELPPYGPYQGPFHRLHVYENDGTGAFSDTGRTVGDPAIQWFKLGDLDGDGDLDAFVFHQVGDEGNYSSVWFNQK